MTARCTVAALTMLVATACAPVTPIHPPAPPASSAPAPDAAGLTWTWHAPAGARVGVPAVDGDDLAFVAGQRELVVVDHQGRERWRAPHVGLRRVAPAFIGDVVVASADDAVVAFDRATGRPRWTVPVPARANAPSPAGASTVVVSTTDGTTRRVDVDTAEVVWVSPAVPGQVLGVAAAGAGAAAVTWEPQFVDQGSGLIVYDLDDGEVRWRVELPPGPTGAPGIVGDEVVVVDASQTIRSFALDDGRPGWSLRTPGAGPAAAAPIGRADDVIVIDRLGVISCVRDGRLRWRHDTDGAIYLAPPASNGRTAVAVLAGGATFAVAGDKATELRVPDGVVGAAVRHDGGIAVAFEHDHGAGVSGWLAPPR